MEEKSLYKTFHSRLTLSGYSPIELNGRLYGSVHAAMSSIPLDGNTVSELLRLKFESDEKARKALLATLGKPIIYNVNDTRGMEGVGDLLSRVRKDLILSGAS